MVQARGPRTCFLLIPARHGQLQGRQISSHARLQVSRLGLPAPSHPLATAGGPLKRYHRISGQRDTLPRLTRTKQDGFSAGVTPGLAAAAAVASTTIAAASAASALRHQGSQDWVRYNDPSPGSRPFWCETREARQQSHGLSHYLRMGSSMDWPLTETDLPYYL